MPLLFDKFFFFCTVRKPETEVELSASHFASIGSTFRFDEFFHHFARITNASRGTGVEIKYSYLYISESI